MNNNIKLVIASVLGSAMTLVVVFWLGLGNKIVKIEHVEGVPVSSAKYNHSTNSVDTPLDFTETAERVTPTVVHIKSTVVSDNSGRNDNSQDPFREFFPFFDFEDRNNDRPQVGIGSGVIISEDGTIVTNNHVIEDATDIEVTLYDNRTYKAALIGTDPSTDLAVIKIEESQLPYLRLGDSDQVRVGQWVLAVGNPFRLNSTVTAGIVSAIGRNINILGRNRSRNTVSPIESFIQTDAAVNPGNSGGALVNVEGDLVGINTAIASRTGSYAGYSFAVPTNIVSKVVEDLLTYGVVQRGYIGAIINGVNGNFAKEKNLSVNEGVYIDSLVSNSAAAEAGIKSGDVITHVDDQPVKDSPKLLELIGRKRPGDNAKITVNRYGREMDFDVELHNRQGNTDLVEQSSQEQLLSRLGADLEDMENDEAGGTGYGSGVQVTRLSPGILQRNTDIREGFIITKADNQKVRSKKDLLNILSEAYDENRGIMLEGVYPNSSRKHYYAFGLNE